MLKNAWLVMTHTNLNQLKKLLKLLDNTDSAIYIHIDSRL